MGHAITRRGPWIVLIGLIALVAAGCGGGGSGATSSGTTTPRNRPVAPGARVIPVTARSFRFDPDMIQIRAHEEVAIQLHALDTLHTFTVQGIGTIVTAPRATTRTGGLRIDTPGRYTFYCSVPGHRAAGMEGTITVEP